jgi:hypothetical protein
MSAGSVHQHSRKRHRSRGRARLITAVAALGAPIGVRGIDYTWIAPSGNWSVAGNWTPAGGPPHFGDRAFLTAGGADVTVTYDALAFAQISQLFVDTTNAANVTLLQQQGALYSGDEVIGFTGHGALKLDGPIIHSLTPASGTDGLYLGFNGGSFGSASISGAAFLSMNGSEYLGYSGNGYLTQSGGFNEVTATGGNNVGLFLGFNAGASGTMVISGGSLDVSASTYVGYSGRASFQLGGSGTHTTAGLVVGGASTSLSTYVMTGGTLNNSGDELIGSGVGSFTQSGGSHTIGGVDGLLIGVGGSNAVASFGTFNLSGGALSINAYEAVGASSPGFLNQSGGSNSALSLAVGVLAPGTFTLSGGLLQIQQISSVGSASSGAFVQLGGTHVTDALIVGGSVAGSVGMYSLAAGSVSAQLEAIGFGAAGTFAQTGGFHSVIDLAIGGTSAAGVGTYVMSGGSLSAAAEIVGPFGPGSFQQSGGTHTVSRLAVGGTAQASAGGGVGTFSLSNGATLIVSNLEAVGAPFNGVFNQTGGTHIIHGTTPTNGLFIGFNTALANTPINGGTFTLSGGSLLVDGPESIGVTTGGVFNQSGGTHTVGGIVSIGGTQAAGIYTMSGGSFSAGSVLNRGPFTQTGGVATFGSFQGTGAVTIGNGAGTALLSVSSLDQSALMVANNGTVIIRQALVRVTNSATALTIIGNGRLDLANHQLLTSDAPSTIKAYLSGAYSANQDWSGPGLTSSIARNNPVKYSVAYASGSDLSAQDAGIAVAPGKVLVRSVLSGDANLDGKVDFFDITQLLGYKYNTGQLASYTDGDLDYSGKVDFFDLTVVLSANYNTGETYLGAAAASPAPAIPSTPVPEPSWGAICVAAATFARRAVRGQGRPAARRR